MIAGLSLILILLCVFARPVLADPDYYSGNFMLSKCKELVDDKTPGVWAGQCAGIIEAFVYAAPHLSAVSVFCPPPRMPPVQAQRVVIRYLETHPEWLDRPFKGLALDALQSAWRCP
jgi:hypothetical protein